MYHKLFAIGLALVVAVSIAARLEAAGVKVGDKAPAFSALIGTDDKNHSLADYADAKAIVLVFTCNHCPVAVAYEDRLVALDKALREKGARLIAVNVNTVPADRLDKMKERAKAKGFEFPYLYDESQQIGKDFGARVTPHVFVLDKERKVAYIGAIDDNQNAEKATTPYVMDVVSSLVAGKQPAKAETKPVGCGIKYNK